MISSELDGILRLLRIEGSDSIGLKYTLKKKTIPCPAERKLFQFVASAKCHRLKEAYTFPSSFSSPEERLL